MPAGPGAEVVGGAVQQGSFADIYRSYYGAVYGYLRVRTRDPELSEDLASETFVRALSAIRTYVARDRPIRAWLFTIARNLLRDELKCARRRHCTTSADPYDDTRAVAMSPDPADLAWSAHVRRLLRTRIAELDADQARCLTLRFFEEHSIDETSAEMNRTSGAVKQLQNRSVKRLRDLITTGSFC
ncbi:sigma-70 family RNA polymerase sigma factor [Amycolatopsis sp. NPDC049691]|uniref:RNA polymerase sigma factor n=1 Tax=Amycolatopsis sp. NPDC049691 TaxID=3155155 RepID=UPI003424E5A5